MKKSILKICCLTICILFLVGCFASCSEGNSNEGGSHSLVIAIGAHANSKKVNISNTQLRKSVYNVCYYGGEVSLVVIDGEPYKLDSFRITPSASSNTKQQKQDYANALTDQILSLIGTAEAKTPEVDLIGALELSSRLLNSSTATNKTFILLDSCLPTKGILSFVDVSLRSNPETVVQQFNSSYNYTDLNFSSIDVTVVGLGDVSYPQTNLSSTERANLKDVLTGIFKTANAANIKIDSDVSTESYESSILPSVSMIPTTADELNIDMIEQSVVIYDESSKISFKPDSTEFINEETAKIELEKYATYLETHPDFVLLIAGSTATVGDRSSCKAFSLERAKKCKQELLKLGINEYQIKILGLGYEQTPYRVNDIDANGKLIEDNAKSNRVTFFMNASLPEAQKLMAL